MSDLKVIKIAKVKELTALSAPSIYRLMKKGTFPKQIKLAERSSAWFLGEINDWIEKKKNIRDEGES